MFFEYRQNNSGGDFDFDEKSGITHQVVIEASSLEEANQKAANIGIYFNGCDSGIDCSCCGDRWSEPWDETGTEAAQAAGKPVAEATGFQWMQDGKEIAVHYADGRICWFGVLREQP